VIAVAGLVTVWIPFTLHLGGIFVIIGLIMVLRNSRRSRRWFIVWSRKNPRWGSPLRRLMRRNPEVWPVFWHEALRAERHLPRRFRRLRQWRGFWRRRRPAAAAGEMASARRR
jgi:hypothetical protein